MIHLFWNLDHHNPLSSWWRMQQNAPKLDDQSLQLEILVAIQCNDDDENQTSYGHMFYLTPQYTHLHHIGCCKSHNCCILRVLQIASNCTVAADGKWSHLDFLHCSAMWGMCCTVTSSRQVVEIPNWWSVDVAKRLVTSQLKPPPLLSSSAGWDWSTKSSICTRCTPCRILKFHS